jgi:hypothetical protein
MSHVPSTTWHLPTDGHQQEGFIDTSTDITGAGKPCLVPEYLAFNPTKHTVDLYHFLGGSRSSRR